MRGGGGGGEEGGTHVRGRGRGQARSGGRREGFTGVIGRKGVSGRYTRETPVQKQFQSKCDLLISGCPSDSHLDSW